MRRLLPLTMLTLVLASGCDEEPETPAESADPIMGLMEFPISHRTDGAPSNAARIEVSPTRMRLDGTTLLEFTGGDLPATALDGNLVAPLRDALAAAGARSSAELSLHANTPYRTTSLVMSTLHNANIQDVAFAVRPVGEPSAAFIRISRFDVREEAIEPYEFPENQMPAWDAVAEGWEAMYGACRENHYQDCDFKPSNIAAGGRTHITLFARGNGVKLEFHRIGEPVEEESEGGSGPALIEGIAPPPEAAEEEAPPTTHATFTWRYNATTDAQSPVSGTMRPICGATSCNALITAEGQTQTMRILSFIGAAFPTGTEAPFVVFQIPPA